VGRPKARRPATAETVSEPHGSAKAGELKRPEATSPHVALSTLSVYDGRCLLGTLRPRGKAGVAAFDVNDRSLGLFPDMKTAAAAIRARVAS
jgi:hypothetical protein